MGPEENTNTSPTVGANPANNFAAPEPQNTPAQPIFFSSTTPSKTSAPIMGQPAVPPELATPEPAPAEPTTPAPAPAPAPAPIQPPVQPQPTLADLAAEAAYAEELKTAPDIILGQDKKPANKKLIAIIGVAVIAIVAIVGMTIFSNAVNNQKKKLLTAARDYAGLLTSNQTYSDFMNKNSDDKRSEILEDQTRWYIYDMVNTDFSELVTEKRTFADSIVKQAKQVKLTAESMRFKNNTLIEKAKINEEYAAMLADFLGLSGDDAQLYSDYMDGKIDSDIELFQDRRDGTKEDSLRYIYNGMLGFRQAQKSLYDFAKRKNCLTSAGINDDCLYNEEYSAEFAPINANYILKSKQVGSILSPVMDNVVRASANLNISAGEQNG